MDKNNKEYDKFRLACEIEDLIGFFEKRYNCEIKSIELSKKDIINDCISSREISFLYN